MASHPMETATYSWPILAVTLRNTTSGAIPPPLSRRLRESMTSHPWPGWERPMFLNQEASFCWEPCWYSPRVDSGGALRNRATLFRKSLGGAGCGNAACALLLLRFDQRDPRCQRRQLLILTPGWPHRFSEPADLSLQLAGG